MFPAPIEHTFTIDGELYRLVEYTRGGEQRIHQTFAASLVVAGIPEATMRSVDGSNLYVEAVARECLKEAPDYFWEERVSAAGQNGRPQRHLTFEQVRLPVWTELCREVNTFLEQIFRLAAPEALAPLPARPPDADAVAAPHHAPTRPYGRAE
jgi:hypothetical protein